MCIRDSYFPVFSVRPVTQPVSVPLQSHLMNIFCLHNFSFYKSPLFVLCLLHPAFICIQRTYPCQFSYPFWHIKRILAQICPYPYYISLESLIDIVYKLSRFLPLSHLFHIWYRNSCNRQTWLNFLPLASSGFASQTFIWFAVFLIIAFKLMQ